MIFGKTVGEYFRFSRNLVFLALVIAITRLALSLGGVPNASARWLSVTVLMWLGTFYYGARVYRTGFGTYRHLFPAILIPHASAQVVIIVGIVIGIFTGQDNVFTSPEFFFNNDGKAWVHVLGHATIGTFVGGTILWLGGCLSMFVTKRLGGTNRRVPSRTVQTN